MTPCPERPVSGGPRFTLKHPSTSRPLRGRRPFHGQLSDLGLISSVPRRPLTAGTTRQVKPPAQSWREVSAPALSLRFHGSRTRAWRPQAMGRGLAQLQTTLSTVFLPVRVPSDGGRGLMALGPHVLAAVHHRAHGGSLAPGTAPRGPAFFIAPTSQLSTEPANPELLSLLPHGSLQHRSQCARTG